MKGWLVRGPAGFLQCWPLQQCMLLVLPRCTNDCQPNSCWACCLQVDQLYRQAAQALKLPEDRFKLVQKGTAITNSAAAAAAREEGSSAVTSCSNSSSSVFGAAKQRPSAVVHLSTGGR